MRILVYPHDLRMGGSQLNAIELAAAVTGLGHECLLYGQPGPLVEYAETLGLEFIESAPLGRRPSLAVVRDLRSLIATREIDVLHGYEWPPGLECHLAALGTKARSLTTVMSMSVAPFLPRTAPVIVGTEQIAAAERASGRRLADVIEPPVDILANAPHLDLNTHGFRARWGIEAERPTIVCVTRLARQLKLEGLLTLIDTIRELDASLGAQLVIVGDGDARQDVEDRARQVNARCGRPAVLLTGELSDPRDAYAVADVAVGMGGSALRAMAFAKPLVVQGESGFFELLTPETLDQFLWTGWYGYGYGTGARLSDILSELLARPTRMKELGLFSRQVVESRFSLEGAARKQERIYERVVSSEVPAPTSAVDGIRSLALFTQNYVGRRYRRLRKKQPSDDFNSAPVARTGTLPRPDAATASEAASQGTLLYFAGVSWDAVRGTDRHLAEHLSTVRDIVWVDPPMSWTARRRRGIDVQRISTPAPNIVRLSTTTPPGVSRPVLRRVAQLLTSAHAWTYLTGSRRVVTAVLLTSPEQHLPRWSRASVRAYFETDDFVDGAALFGTSPRYARRCRRVNVSRADLALAVTDRLLDRMGADPTASFVLGNGCDPDHYADVEALAPADDVALPPPVAGVVGQLNERLDLSALQAVADSGASLLLVGPKYVAQEESTRRLDDLLERANVQWIDRRSYDELPRYLAAIDVGLTPYERTPFNTSSFPLKLLEYLSAARPVVSTDIPAARAIGTPHIATASSPEEFAHLVMAALAAPPTYDDRRAMIAVADANSWAARATRLNTLLSTTPRRRRGEARA